MRKRVILSVVAINVEANFFIKVKLNVQESYTMNVIKEPRKH